MSGETVTTWADGFGNWHAKVTFPAPGYGPAYLEEHGARIRAKAQRAIKREIEKRSGPANWTGYRVRVQVEANELNAQNQMRSIVYGEATK